MLDIVMQVKIYGGRWEKGQLEQQVGCPLSSTLQIVVWNVLTPVEVIAPGLYVFPVRFEVYLMYVGCTSSQSIRMGV
jgi:hypothetical protein